MKYTEDKKVNVTSHVDLGDEKVHVKTTITMPFVETDETSAIVEDVRNLHKGIDDLNQRSLPLDDDPEE